MAPSTPEAARVTAPWTASYDPALNVAQGQRLVAGRVDPDNPGWRWCEDQTGLGGWLPDGLVVDGVATRDFDSTELTVTGGEAVRLIAAHAGWHLCRLQDGRTGWLPDACLTHQ